MRQRQAPAEVREVLEQATIEGPELRMPPLERRLFTKVKPVLEAIGARWDRRRGAFVFAEDPRAVVAAIVGGDVVPASERAREGFVATPPELAARVVGDYGAVEGLPAGSVVLEPSAGDGALVRAVLEANPDVLVCAIEPNLGRAESIPTRPEVDLTVTRFEDFQARREYDAVVMNPPYSTAESTTLWIDHLWRAWELLRGDGLLTCIAPAAFTWRQDRRHLGVRELVARHGAFDELEPDAFPLAIHAGVLQLRRSLLIEDLTQELAEAA